MKSPMMKLIIPTLILASPLSHATPKPPVIRNSPLQVMGNEGVGVGDGSGGNTLEEETAAKITKQLQGYQLQLQPSLQNSTQINPSLRPHPTLGKSPIRAIKRWCQGVSQLLVRYRATAVGMVHRGGIQDIPTLENAITILETTLFSVLRSVDLSPGMTGPLTHTLLVRAQEYIRSIDQYRPTVPSVTTSVIPTLPKRNQQQKAFPVPPIDLEIDPIEEYQTNMISFLNSKFNLLEKYVSFIIKTEMNLDRPYFVDYWFDYSQRFPNCYQDCGAFQYNAFQNRYLDFAADLVRFSIDHFTVGGPRIAPAGNREMVLKIIQLSTGYAAHDIAITLYGYAMAQPVIDLSEISENLRFRNAGYQTYYNERWIFNALNEELRCVIDQIDRRAPQYSCQLVYFGQPTSPCGSFPMDPGFGSGCGLSQ
ncbi:MAG: hypothetical protein CL678_18865 [Bdellovibrionaceae bacterium]|nr:hypothetical protein [Pseudobdellovibrionaceae bacterium]|tara:strand:- start:5415 stop:6680 length:1266 start_codon:yes stop_codon:yes gene_type:complete